MSNKIPTAKTKIDETKAEQEKPKPENNSWKQKCQTKSPQQKAKSTKQKLNRENQNRRIIDENKNMNFGLKMKKKKRQWRRKKAKRNEEERKETQLVSGEMKPDSISVWHAFEMKAEEMHTAKNEARPKYTHQQMKQGQNDMEQPKTEAKMPKKPLKWTHVNSWSMGTIGISLDNSFIRLNIDLQIEKKIKKKTN